ncbi:transmembrane protein 220 isoform X1 [Protobothrops mucrosquamatus]|uniref:transmembrane protein 220 isoform X1 n=1 Tax=Protobothrops mucrosquamatus TaxID=103944 RepID=UPI000775C5C5|nr:transmembrane protein 220 isoform X1 [Protobothrops mucrosquamatus]
MEADCFSLPPVPGPSRLWRLSNLIMAVFFALAGAVQINDPDPGLWIVVYSVPACLALIVSLNPPITDNIMWRSISDLHSAACVVGSAVLGYSLVTTAQNNILHEEEGRELFGLVIVTAWMSLCRNSAKNSLGGFHLIIAIFLCLFPFVMWLYIYVNTEMRESWPSHCKTAI